jgi:DNA-binding protein H-NS
MTTINLAHLSSTDLQQLEVDVEVEIKEREQQKVADARKKILAIAQSVGMDVKDLMGKTPTKKRSSKPVAAKYRNPADAGQTWTGRGRKPKWVEALLAEGKALAELGI